MTTHTTMGSFVSHRVAVFAPSYPPAFRGGGPARSTQALVKNAPSGFAAFVVTPDRDLNQTDRLPVIANEWQRRDNHDVYYVSVDSPRRLWEGLRAVRERRPQLLHFNSFFNPRLTILPLLLWFLGYWGRARVLLAPRGEFGKGALGRRAPKKRAYIMAFKALGIHRRVIWHSTAPHETIDLRNVWGTDITIVERENDTLLPRLADTPAVTHDGAVRTVFLGRIVEHKGLAVALEALKETNECVEMDVFGAREDLAYFSRCQAIAQTLARTARVVFHDPVEPDGVRSLLSRYDVLVMPTAGENFGHVIAEALSVGCAVMVTPHTPWTETVQGGAGLVVKDRAPSSWRDAMDQVARLDPVQRLRLRRAAADGFNAWASQPRHPHIWSLVMPAGHAVARHR